MSQHLVYQYASSHNHPPIITRKYKNIEQTSFGGKILLKQKNGLHIQLLSNLTILPLGVLNGHADEYSKLVLGSITGCSPITPLPLQSQKKDEDIHFHCGCWSFL